MSCKRPRTSTINNAGNTFIDCVRATDFELFNPEDPLQNMGFKLKFPLYIIETADNGQEIGPRGVDSIDLQAEVQTGSRTAQGLRSTIIGGQNHQILSSGLEAIILGGDCNDATGSQCATLGGRFNVAGGSRTLALGGQNNVTGGFQSIAMGTRSKATHSGSLVLSDSQEVDKNSWGTATALLRYNGGINLDTDATGIVYAKRLRLGSPADPNQSTMDIYETISLAGNWGGWDLPKPVTVRLTKVGTSATGVTVTAYFENGGVSNSSGPASSPQLLLFIPAGYRPFTSTWGIVPFVDVDSSITSIGTVRVNSVGDVLVRNPMSDPFTPTSTLEIGRFTMSWTI